MKRWWLSVFGGTKSTRFEFVRCHSLVHEKVVGLSSEYLNIAAEVRVDLLATFPLVLGNGNCRLSFRLLSPLREPITGASALAFSETKQGRRISTLSIECPPSIACQSSVILQVVHAAEAIYETELRQLDGQQLAAELQLHTCAIHGKHGGKELVSDCLHDKVEGADFHVGLTLPNSEHRDLIDQLEFPVQASVLPLDGQPRVQKSWQTQLRFNGPQFSWHQSLFGAGGCLEIPAGSYALMFHAGSKVLATTRFSVCSFEDYHAAVVAGLPKRLIARESSVTAIDQHTRSANTTTIAEDYKALQISVGIEIPGQDLLLSQVSCPVLISVSHPDSASVVMTWTSRLTLSIGSKSAVSTKVAVTETLFSKGSGRYQLHFTIAGAEVLVWNFTHRTRAEIRAEKEEGILKSLAVSDARLLVRRDGQVIHTDSVFESDTFIGPAFSLTARGFDSDMPDLRARFCATLTRLDGVEVVRQEVLLAIFAGQNNYEGIPPVATPIRRQLAPGNYVLKIERHNRAVTEHAFSFLSREQASEHSRQVIIGGLRSDGIEISARYGDTVVQTDRIAECADHLIATFNVGSDGFNSLVPRLTTRVQVSVARRNGSPIRLTEVQINIEAHRTTSRTIRIRIRGASLSRSYGRHHLTLTVEGKQVAQSSFEVVDVEEAVRRLKVDALSLNAECHNGSNADGVSTVSVAQHKLLRPRVVFRPGVLIPNLSVAVSIVITEGKTVMMQANLDLQLDREEIAVTLKAIPIHSFRGDGRRATRRFSISVHVSEAVRANRTFMVICFEQLTDFEGRLHTDADRLPVDDRQYDEIMRSLRN